MRLVWFVFGFLCLGEMAFAGGNTLVQPSPPSNPENLGSQWSILLDSTYTFGSHVERSHNLGSQAEYRYEIQALRNFRITGDYYLELGVDYERFDFSRSNSQFPYSFTSLSGEILFSYWSGDSFYPVIRLEPGIYYTRDHVTENSFVFPIGGFNWKINDKFNLRAVFPRPRLSYTPNDKLEIYVGGELIGNSYRNGPTNDRRTNNAI